MALASFVSRAWHCYTDGRAADGLLRTSHAFRVYLRQNIFVIKYRAIKTCGTVEVGLHALLIAELAGGVCGQLHAPAALSLRRAVPYPLDRRVDGPQNRDGGCREQEGVCPCLRSRSGHRSCSAAILPTENK